MTTEKVTIYICDYCGQRYLEHGNCKECEEKCKATKFKVGDKVRVKTVNEMLFAGYSIVDDDIVFSGNYSIFVKYMVKYCGKEFTIAHFNRIGSYTDYRLRDDSNCVIQWLFAEPCLELVKEK